VFKQMGRGRSVVKSRNRIALAVAVIVLSAGCDQLTKRVAADTLKFSPPHSFLWDIFRLQYSENPGAFLSLGAGLPGDTRTLLFKWGVGALLAGALAFTLLNNKLKPLSVMAMSLFIGGGFSNLADRIVRGDVVVDFMNAGIGRLRTGVFNVADLSIVAGVLLLAVAGLLEQDSHPARPANETSPD
jgi:signal peptidase II